MWGERSATRVLVPGLLGNPAWDPNPRGDKEASRVEPALGTREQGGEARTCAAYTL